MMKKITVIVLFLTCFGLIANAQKKIHGTYKLNLSENRNMTLAEAEKECEKQAKLNALTEAFGIDLSDFQKRELVQNGNDDAQSNFRQVTEQRAKGTWQKNTKEPKFTYSCVNDIFFIECEVWGEGREKRNTNIDLQWKILVGSPDLKNEGTIFNNKQKLFINVKIPHNGYLAVYLVDEKAGQVTRLLPYWEDKDGVFDVVQGKEYTLFDKDNYSNLYPRRIELATSSKMETDKIVLVYSYKKFAQCYTTKGPKEQFGSCKYADFEQWLINSENADDSMIHFEQEVKIINNQAEE